MRSSQEIQGKAIKERIRFNVPYLSGNELVYIADAHSKGQLAGDGEYTKRCQHLLEQQLQIPKVLLTHSCTAALEMAALLIDIKPGDEVIMPSYTFVSTANAFVLRGAKIVFVDIDAETKNIDAALIQEKITDHTRAIVAVHYAGVTCDMKSLGKICNRENLFLIEDAAQAIYAKYDNKYAGTFGDLGCLSFHETKNIISGEGGALLINNKQLIERAEIIREKGTNRSKFLRGQIDKYSWVDIGSSFLPGELTAAFLLAQLEEKDKIISARMAVWDKYYSSLKNYQSKEIKIMSSPLDRQHNGHMFYISMDSMMTRDKFIDYMNKSNIQCVFHYVPLHNSQFFRSQNDYIDQNLPVTESTSKKLVRLPFWTHLPIEKQEIIIEKTTEFLLNR